MTSINKQMGLKPAGTRAFMKLPTTRSEAVRVTSAKCPICTHTGARPSKTQPGKLYCSWCNFIFDMPASDNPTDTP